ncbi:9849_t:CDS:2 [Diversispora eburnea]|uniref:9849_t:CDS:1 n=1 Tax=Diversispora eburnea TaxID=1213867 RepID=A0A9N9AIL7_9GLOM|nr:9849_t:CDS:2 [Diversispora eburnea]
MPSPCFLSQEIMKTATTKKMTSNLFYLNLIYLADEDDDEEESMMIFVRKLHHVGFGLR